MSAYDIKSVFDGGWLIYEREGAVCMYLVCGSEKAALIDAGIGTGDLMAAASELTELPILPIITHGHPDHYLGVMNCPFVYLDERDHNLMRNYTEQIIREEVMSIPHVPELRPLPEIFDLGGRTLRTVELRGHTQGSVGFLLEEDRILFSGDGLIYNVWMQLDESTTLTEYRSTLENLRALQPQFDFLWTGHGPEALPAKHLDNVIDLLDKVLETPFGVPNPTNEPPGLIADGEGCRITYRRDKMGTAP